MTIYERIRELRLARHMTQGELAEKIGYANKTAVCKVERGQWDISKSTIEKFAQALGTTPVYLMYGDINPQDEYDVICGWLMNTKEGRALLRAVKDASPEDLMRTITVLNALKGVR